MALRDSPTQTQQRLIDVVARGFHEAGDKWPVYQYVEAQLDSSLSVDASAVLRTCPRFNFGLSVGSYGWFRVTGQHPYEPAPEDQVTLSVAGMARSTELKSQADLFVRLVDYLAGRLRTFSPDPGKVIDHVVTSREILEHFDSLTRPQLRTTQMGIVFLVEVLGHEPPVWQCQVERTGDEFSIKLNPKIRRYVNLRDVDDYLQRFEDQFSAPPQPSTPVYPAQLALPESIDYLNAKWQVQPGHTGPLFPVDRAEAAARLARDCADAAEFDSALSAFNTIMGRLNLPQGKKSLFELRSYLKRNLPDESQSRALEGVDDLIAVIDLRVWRQHGNSKRLDRGMRRLNVQLPAIDWSATWALIQWRSVRALNAIREEVEHGHFLS